MKKRHKVVLNLGRLSIPEKLGKARNYVKALEDNPRFPNPIPSLAEIRSIIDQLERRYIRAIELRQSASHETALQNQQEVFLDKLLTALGNYVDVISMGDEASIRSAGMDVRAGNTPVGIPDPPGSFVSAEGPLRGTIKLKWKAVRGARAYIIAVTENISNEANWQQLGIVTKSSFLVRRLTPGKQYWFQVAANGAAGQGAWSDPVMRVAP